jgi:hypothetical protein
MEQYKNFGRSPKHWQKKHKRAFLLGGLLMVGFVLWESYKEAAITQSQRVQEEAERQRARKESESAIKVLAGWTVQDLIPSSDPRIEMQKGNLTIHIKESDFKKLSDADRLKLIKALADKYCPQLWGFLPRIKIKDTGTGQELGAKVCLRW